MYDDDDLLPISALSHLAYCERRAALVHIERVWTENVFTVEGLHLHEKTHKAETESRDNIRIARGLRLRSLRLGLSGMADVVEFHRIPEACMKDIACSQFAISLEDAKGLWSIFPVEYKRGKIRHEQGFELQLCAQSICLEEMLDVKISDGAIFYGKTKRRLAISFDDSLRAKTEAAAVRLHVLFEKRTTPPAVREKKCDNCSLFEQCMPEIASPAKSASGYLRENLAAILREVTMETKR